MGRHVHHGALGDGLPAASIIKMGGPLGAGALFLQRGFKAQMIHRKAPFLRHNLC